MGVGSVIQSRDGAVSDLNLLYGSVMKRRSGPRLAPVVLNLIVNPLRMRKVGSFHETTPMHNLS